MVSLEINTEIKKKHKEYLLNNGLGERLEELKSREFLAELEKIDKNLMEETKLFYDYLVREYEDLKNDKDIKNNIFLGEPEVLQKKICYIKEKYKKVSSEFLEERKIGKKTYSDKVLGIIGYSQFSKKNLKISTEKIIDLYNYKKYRLDNPKSWSAYDFVMSMGLKVCPYCNRNFVTPLYAEKRKTRAALDHFWPKKKYPYLSMSIYNLVPSCSVCNSGFKGEEQFELEKNINPYENIEIESLYHFTYKVDTYEDFTGKNDIDITIKYDKGKSGQRLKNNNEIFRIENIYQYHGDVVMRLLQKKMIYDENYIEFLLNKYDLFTDREEVITFLTEAVGETEVKDHILGKLIHDIVKELEF